MASCVAALQWLSYVHALCLRPSCFLPCVDVTCRVCDVMRSPESSRAAMFGCADGYTLWVWIVSRWIVEPCLADYREPLTVGRGVESSLNPIDGTMSGITTVSHFTVRRGEGVVEGVCAAAG